MNRQGCLLYVPAALESIDNGVEPPPTGNRKEVSCYTFDNNFNDIFGRSALYNLRVKRVKDKCLSGKCAALPGTINMKLVLRKSTQTGNQLGSGEFAVSFWIYTKTAKNRVLLASESSLGSDGPSFYVYAAKKNFAVAGMFTNQGKYIQVNFRLVSAS